MPDLIARLRGWLGIDEDEHAKVDRKLERQQRNLDRLDRVADEQKQLAVTLRNVTKAMRSDAKR